MSALTIINEEGQWGVWIGLDNTNPRTSPFGFCIGVGTTRNKALAEAVADLESATDALQQAHGKFVGAVEVEVVR